MSDSINADAIIFGLMSLGIFSILVVGWSYHAWQKIKERQERLNELNRRVQNLLDSDENDYWRNK